MGAGENKGNSSSNEDVHEKLAHKVQEASEAIRDLIRTISVGVEERIAIDDQIKNITNQAESMLGRIDAVTKANQRKLLLAYKKFLERNLEAVNQRIKDLQ